MLQLKTKYWVSGVVFFLMLLSLEAQELPPVSIYSPEMYGADNQNWAVSQSEEKIIYVANNKGLLEFNGEQWQLYNSPSGKMRSVLIIDDLIYTGSYREFGYWQKNDIGKLYYTSLSTKLGIEFPEDEDFWNIIAIDQSIFFQSLKRIYIYNTNEQSYNVINSETDIYKMLKVDKDIYFQKIKDGIYKLENGEPKLISNAPVFKNNLLVNIFNYNNGLLIETEENGFYVLKNNELNEWLTKTNNLISQLSVYRSIQLKDKSFILGTRSNGIVHITLEGEVNYAIDAASGLGNNTIHGLFEDAENNIWLALDNGINCINIKSPFSVYNSKDGKIGTVYTSIIFDDHLYLGTNQGLFYRAIGSDDEFKFVENTQGPVWCLSKFDNTLFCGHANGTFVINNNIADLKVDIQGTWNILPVNGNKDLLIQGNYDGLYILEKNNDEWGLRNKIEGFDISSKFFEIYNQNQIFVSHEFKGVYKITVNDNFTQALEVVKDSTLEKGLNSSLIKYNGNLLYTYKEGTFKYNDENKVFYKDTLLSKLFIKEEYTSGKLHFDSINNTLWIFSKKNLNYLSPDKFHGTLKIKNIPLSEAFPRGLSENENITHFKDRQYLLGTSKGYIILDLDKVQNKSYDIAINSVILYDLDNSPQFLNPNIKGAFKNKENNIDISYHVPEFDKYSDNEYQYQLLGIYPEWSSWSEHSMTSFKNLPYGDYVFNVRAKVKNGLSNNVSSYRFNIERPWYLSNFFVASYVFAILLFSLFMHTIYKRYYKKQRERILLKTTRELELKELENKEQLMRFNNDKLRQDIENKNRELGISTMSLIKKNEFLNNIKKELLKTDGGKQLKHIIKIIDRNLNNTDDWQAFEEAFNNADKDFLKKIKLKFPELTPNDLRLCAYLRLNLSSKEIAPLLNISTRSVEVKRYRLRKKMGLPHESSLTDYILEV